ncbi:MAG: SpaH/EbpB family LPXTG-anchored major pilin [Anaerobutyricum hallii]|uniref:SpaH/EbpB family LPXTG-anchored major pilin n=1 Tax=Anaerobutyricum hallii TaxID=39488 RepID=UPI002A7FC8FA|nr:SpaH/EbpB family LPXTG-anchored major pilin [Anaerobutyricum hallii]MDY4577631.1 SpaH/EbpB family LPXTG-anchored major pilin [Anaerobutyricum hallii]
MKKLWKKLLAVTTAVMMAITLLPAMANAESTITNPQAKGSLTINKTTDKEDADGKYPGLGGAEFTIYKVASLEPGTNGKYKAWKLTTDFARLSLTPDTLGSISTADLEAKANEAKKIAADLTGQSQTTADGTGETRKGEATFSNLELGYYLVVETKTPSKYVASKPFFVSIPETVTTADGSTWNYNVSVSPKNQGIPDTDKVPDKKTVGVGDEVTYTITGPTVPNYDEAYNETTLKYEITDTLSTGLTFAKDKADLKVYTTDVNSPLVEDTDYTFEYDSTANKITISLISSKIRDLKGEAIHVKYTVTVNENAVVGSDGTINKAEVEYTNNPDGTTDGSKKEVKVYSFKIKINKKKDNGSPLKGATFGLYRDAACADKIEEATSGDDGVINFGDASKLAAGTYYLKELQAPSGYSALTSVVKVVISTATPNDNTIYDFKYSMNEGDENNVGEDGVISLDITNNKGFNLPATGGMGTYLFTIGGLVIMAGAALLLIASKKRRA